MAAVTTTNKYVLPLGPIKMEVADLASVDDADTYVTTIQNPSFGFFVENTDTATIAVAVNLGFSGRTVTFNSTDLGAATGVLIVFGF